MKTDPTTRGLLLEASTAEIERLRDTNAWILGAAKDVIANLPALYTENDLYVSGLKDAVAAAEQQP